MLGWTKTSAVKLKNSMKRRGYSQTRLSECANISRASVNYLVNCRYTNITLKTILEVCKILGVSMEWLLDENKTTIRDEMEAAMIVMNGEDVYTRGEACEVIARFFAERAKAFRKLEEEENGN